jgi:hypothetical protein
VVPHSTLPGEIHWLWYHITHFQMKYTQCISPGSVSYGTTTSVFHLAMCCEVPPQPVYFTWQSVMRCHNQCKYTDCGTAWHIFRWKALVVAPHNTLPSEIHWLWWYLTTHCQVKYTGCDSGATTSAFHLKMCHAVPQPVYFSWQCVMRYHSLYISPGNVLCGTRTSVFHLAMCYAAPQPVLWYRMTHYQVKYTDCGTVRHIARLHWSWYRMTLSPVKGTGRGTIWHIVSWNTLVTWQCAMRYQNQCISPGNVLCGNTTSVLQLAMYYAVPQPMYFTWHYVILYHNQCISPDNVSYGTTTHISRWNTLVVVP